MKIAGLLSWYDESPSWLATAVAGIGQVCDLVVAVDGAYALYPQAQPRSHPQQAEAVMQAAESAGIGCVIYRPQEVFHGNEVAKRNMTLALAAPLLTADEDWVLVFDGDWHVRNCNPVKFRATLEETDKDVALYTLIESLDYLNTSAAAFARNTQLDPTWRVDGPIFRWHPTLRYGPAHFVLSRERDGEREWVAGPDGKMVDHVSVHDSLVAYHRHEDRALVRKQSAQTYYRVRDVSGIEELGVAPLEAVVV